MKYELTPLELKEINSGNMLTCACYNPQNAALTEYALEYQNIPFKYEVSESPTGKSIIIFFFTPQNNYKAFRIGEMINSDLHKQEASTKVEKWAGVFKKLSGIPNFQHSRNGAL